MQLEAQNGKYYLSGEFKEIIHFQGQEPLYATATSPEYYLAIFDIYGSAQAVYNVTELFPSSNHLSQFVLDETGNILFGMSIGTGSQICKIDGNANLLQTIEQEDVAIITSIDFDPFGNIIVGGAFADTECYFGGVLFEVDTQDNYVCCQIQYRWRYPVGYFCRRGTL
jgi:hypothetical protein